jgi:hypothetical protein
MRQPEPQLKKAEILQVVRQSKQDLLAVLRALNRCEERADSALQYLCGMERSLAAECQAGVPGMVMVAASKESRIASGRRIRKSWKQLKELARLGVARLEFQWLPSGSAFVQVNDATVFKLSQTLARLLEILAKDSTPGNAALVGWKSYAEVAYALQKEFGRRFSKHAINQLVSRLRCALVDRGNLNPFFVESHRQFGLRFLRQRQEKV